MKKITRFLLAFGVLFILSACDASTFLPQKEKEPLLKENVLQMTQLDQGEEELLLQLSSAFGGRAAYLFDYAVDQSFEQVDIWVEIYHYGEIINYVDGLRYGRHYSYGISNQPEDAQKASLPSPGRLIVTFRDYGNRAESEWRFAVASNGGTASRSGGLLSYDLFTYGGTSQAYHTEPTAIEADKEIILFMHYVFYGDDDQFQLYPELIEEDPDFLKQVAYVTLVKCRFT